MSSSNFLGPRGKLCDDPPNKAVRDVDDMKEWSDTEMTDLTEAISCFMSPPRPQLRRKRRHSDAFPAARNERELPRRRMCWSAARATSFSFQGLSAEPVARTDCSETPSTPDSPSMDCPVSILRTSPWCPSPLRTTSNSPKKAKQVRIASPVKWYSQSKESIERKRECLRSTISHREIQRILREIGCDAAGGYNECVDRLLASDWTPPRKYIESEERFRAKPIEHDSEKIIELLATDDLEKFSTDDLKLWLTQNRIAFNPDRGRAAIVALVGRARAITTPLPTSVRSRLCPKTVGVKKWKCKTPRLKGQALGKLEEHSAFHGLETLSTQLQFD